jgi:hypothetical protein
MYCVANLFRCPVGMGEERPTSAALEDLVSSFAFALRFAWRKRIHDADVFFVRAGGAAAGGVSASVRLRGSEAGARSLR